MIPSSIPTYLDLIHSIIIKDKIYILCFTVMFTHKFIHRMFTNKENSDPPYIYSTPNTHAIRHSHIYRTPYKVGLSAFLLKSIKILLLKPQLENSANVLKYCYCSSRYIYIYIYIYLVTLSRRVDTDPWRHPW